MSARDMPHEEESMITDVNRMTSLAHAVCADLQELHGVKSVAQSKADYSIKVVAHDDYAILSHIQTVCAWHQSDFDIQRAAREDGNMVVRFQIRA